MLQERHVRTPTMGTRTTVKWIPVRSFSMAWHGRNVKKVSLSPLNTAAVSVRLLIVSAAAHFMIQCLSKWRNMPNIFKTMNLETYGILREDGH